MTLGIVAALSFALGTCVGAPPSAVLTDQPSADRDLGQFDAALLDTLDRVETNTTLIVADVAVEDRAANVATEVDDLRATVREARAWLSTHVVPDCASSLLRPWNELLDEIEPAISLPLSKGNRSLDGIIGLGVAASALGDARDRLACNESGH